MLEFSSQRCVGSAFVLCFSLVCGVACNQSAERTVQASAETSDGPEPVTLTVFTDKVELFMEYPRLVPGLEARFLAHVTVLATGEPVRSGQLRLELTGASTGPVQLQAARPKRDGLFIPVGTFDTPGTYTARIVVTSEQVEETIELEPIVVHADLAQAHAAAQRDALPEPADAVPFLLEQQWKIGLLMEPVKQRSLTRRLLVPGEVQAPHHAMAVVSAPLDGRLLPPTPEGRLPKLGERVQRGQLLGYLEPPLTASVRAQRISNAASHDTLEVELMVREYDLKAKRLELERDLLAARAQLAFAQLALERIEGLRAKDLGTMAELEAARRDRDVVQEQITGATSLREAYASSREQLAELRKRNASKRPSGSSAEQQLQPLLAPITGEIVSRDHVQGEHVEALGELYRVLDLERVWIAAQVSEFDLGKLPQVPGALVHFAAFPERSFDILGELNGKLVNVGRVVESSTRTLTLRYELANPDGLLRAGMFADVYLETGHVAQAVAIPQTAVLMDNGRAVAFVLLHGELFQKRVLELGIRDGAFVEVQTGLSVGERVVTSGAYLVKLASASPASFGAGHAH